MGLFAHANSFGADVRYSNSINCGSVRPNFIYNPTKIRHHTEIVLILQGHNGNRNPFFLAVHLKILNYKEVMNICHFEANIE